MEAVRLVACTDSTVLIQGETGTGKELIATAIHEESSRRRGPFVKVNCAAMPAALLESELFGHERGAFTGAITQTVGRFQLANQGTLLLDEIGELPLELQPKLLRVLQQQEFERLGSNRTIRVNVRVVAATNQNLEQMVEERKFRADLFYRLNVFPVALPPLRERRDDIPQLVRHFVEMFTNRMYKDCLQVDKDTMTALRNCDWPGNVRQLQNVIERAVILSPGHDLRVRLSELPRRKAALPVASEARTLAEAEREHITKVLDVVDWRIGGRNGAAAMLGVARTSLLYRMQKLGIAPRHGALPGSPLSSHATGR
jgi:formate hydrogenlyase transcriptional activator